jgi:hypothetical protein
MTSGSSSHTSLEQSSRRPAMPSARDGEAQAPRLSTAVMFVHDLDASVSFYSEILQMTTTVREPTAALLVNAASCQLCLRQMGPRTPHPLGGIGVQYVIWTAPSRQDLQRCERALTKRCHHVTRHVVDGITFIEGVDPSGVPVVITYPGPDRAARRAIMKRVYWW